LVTDAETYKSITGEDKTSVSVMKVDPNYGYVYGRNDDKGNFIEKGRVPFDAGKIKLTKTYKSGLDARYNNGGGKPITKPKPKKSTGKKVTDPALLRQLNGG